MQKGRCSPMLSFFFGTGEAPAGIRMVQSPPESHNQLPAGPSPWCATRILARAENLAQGLTGGPGPDYQNLKEHSTSRGALRSLSSRGSGPLAPECSLVLGAALSPIQRTVMTYIPLPMNLPLVQGWEWQPQSWMASRHRLGYQLASCTASCFLLLPLISAQGTGRRNSVDKRASAGRPHGRQKGAVYNRKTPPLP